MTRPYGNLQPRTRITGSRAWIESPTRYDARDRFPEGHVGAAHVAAHECGGRVPSFEGGAPRN